MESLKKYFFKRAGLRYLILWGSVFLIFNIIVFPFFKNLMNTSAQQYMLDLFFGYSREDAFLFLDRIGEDGRSVHLIATLAADMIYPFVYTIFLSFLLSLMLKKLSITEGFLSYLIFLPFVIMAFDFIENSAIAVMLVSFPEITEAMVKAGSFAGMAKWCSTGFVLIVVLVLSVILLTKKISPVSK